jgi:hypothetical protein
VRLAWSVVVAATDSLQQAASSRRGRAAGHTPKPLGARTPGGFCLGEHGSTEDGGRGEANAHRPLLLRFAASSYVSPSRNRGYDPRDINAPLSVKQRHPTSRRSLDAPRDNPPSLPRRSASAPAAPRLWPTPRDPGAHKPLSQKRVRTPQNANAPAGGPGAFTLNRSARRFRARLLK